MSALAFARRFWRELALALAVAVAFGMGRHSSQIAQDRAQWVERVAGAELTVDSLRRAMRATGAVVHTAGRTLTRTVERWRVIVDTLHGPTGGPSRVDTVTLERVVAAGDRVARSCTAYQTACERDRAVARRTIRALDSTVRLLRRPPGVPRLTAYGAGGWDVTAAALAIRGGLELRVAGAWSLRADLTEPLTPHPVTTLSAWVAYRFR